MLAAVGRLNAPRPRAHTAFYDALRLALERSRRGRHAKRVVVALTDRMGDLSTPGLPAMHRAVVESDALVYCIGLATSSPVKVPYESQGVLISLSVPTGGAAFFPTGARELLAAADFLAAELRSQYALGFAAGPSEKRDGWHELKVKLNDLRDEKGKRVGFEVRARRGFYDERARLGASSQPARR